MSLILEALLKFFLLYRISSTLNLSSLKTFISETSPAFKDVPVMSFLTFPPPRGVSIKSTIPAFLSAAILDSLYQATSGSEIDFPLNFNPLESSKLLRSFPSLFFAYVNSASRELISVEYFSLFLFNKSR